MKNDQILVTKKKIN